MLSVVNCLFDNYLRYLSFTKVEHSTQSLVWTCKLSERSWRSFFRWCTHVLSYKWQMDDIFWTAHMLSVCIHIDNPRGSISQSLHCSFLNFRVVFLSASFSIIPCKDLKNTNLVHHEKSPNLWMSLSWSVTSFCTFFLM